MLKSYFTFIIKLDKIFMGEIIIKVFRFAGQMLFRTSRRIFPVLTVQRQKRTVQVIELKQPRKMKISFVFSVFSICDLNISFNFRPSNCIYSLHFKTL